MVEQRFEWDDSKNRTNVRKHRLAFEDAVEVFRDPLHRTMFDGIENGEERWRTYGIVDGVALLMVAHVYRDDAFGEVVRIVSARLATRHERRFYEWQDG